jgi:hypothetical protein
VQADLSRCSDAGGKMILLTVVPVEFLRKRPPPPIRMERRVPWNEDIFDTVRQGTINVTTEIKRMSFKVALKRVK